MEAYTLWKNYKTLTDQTKSDPALSERDGYEVRNIIERFVLSERQATPENYNTVVDKMRAELAEKRIPPAWADKILQHLNVHTATKPLVQDNRFSYGECNFTLDKQHLAALKRYPTYNPMDVIALYMYYNTGTNGSQQWSIPPAFYREAYKHLGDSYSVVEGCASLFNSNMLVVNPDATPCYCSLNPLETRYGSLGKLDQVLPVTKTLGDKPVFWIVNPPFIESVMISLGALLLQHATDFFWIMPYWSDSTAYTQFAEAVTTRGLTQKILRKKTYSYWDGTKTILANFDSVVFTTAPKLVAMLT